jgi:hypothetical protein
MVRVKRSIKNHWWIIGFLVTLLSAAGQIVQAQTPVVDLTTHQPSAALPAGVTLEWHNALPISAGSIITGTQTTSATPGVYYAAYNFGGLPLCYSEPSYLRILTNTCPATTVDLSAGVDPATVPVSATVTFHSSATASAANQLGSSTVTANSTETTYYAAFRTFDASTNTYCYSEASPIVVVLTNCTVVCTLPAVGGTAAYSGGAICPTTNAGTIILTGQTGGVVKWQTSTDGGANWTDLPNSAANKYYNFFNAANGQQYRAVLNTGGINCPDEYSSPATITTSAAACLSLTCDRIAGTISFGATPAVVGSNYSTQMVMTDASGQIQYVSAVNSTSVVGVAAGNYFVYQVTYDNTLTPLPRA